MKPVLLLTLLAGTAQAADGRDPTRWPTALQAAVAPAPTASAAGIAPGAVRQVLIQDGRAFVVAHGRRHAVGDTLDGARIERITEQAVWLRESGQLRREPLYGGVEKRTPPPAPKNSKEKP